MVVTARWQLLLQQLGALMTGSVEFVAIESWQW
jgi:hypothetical protein